MSIYRSRLRSTRALLLLLLTSSSSTTIVSRVQIGRNQIVYTVHATQCNMWVQRARYRPYRYVR